MVYRRCFDGSEFPINPYTLNREPISPLYSRNSRANRVWLTAAIQFFPDDGCIL